MTFLISTSRTSWVSAARRDLARLERQLPNATAEAQAGLLEEIEQLRREINERICVDQQHIGWR